MFFEYYIISILKNWIKIFSEYNFFSILYKFYRILNAKNYKVMNLYFHDYNIFHAISIEQMKLKM